MIDHLSVGVNDIEKGKAFYGPVMEAIGAKQLAEMDGLVAYGKERIEFLIMLPFNKENQTSGNGVHIALVAQDDAAVDALYNAALENGGADEGKPGVRAYPHAEVYAAYVRDPFGNKLEVLRGGFAA